MPEQRLSPHQMIEYTRCLIISSIDFIAVQHRCGQRRKTAGGFRWMSSKGSAAPPDREGSSDQRFFLEILITSDRLAERHAA
jgi:hypothetical protein